MPEEVEEVIRSFKELKNFVGRTMGDPSILQDFNNSMTVQRFMVDFIETVDAKVREMDDAQKDPQHINTMICWMYWMLFRAGYEMGHEDGVNGRRVLWNPRPVQGKEVQG